VAVMTAAVAGCAGLPGEPHRQKARPFVEPSKLDIQTRHSRHSRQSSRHDMAFRMTGTSGPENPARSNSRRGSTCSRGRLPRNAVESPEGRLAPSSIVCLHRPDCAQHMREFGLLTSECWGPSDLNGSQFEESRPEIERRGGEPRLAWHSPCRDGVSSGQTVSHGWWS